MDETGIGSSAEKSPETTAFQALRPTGSSGTATTPCPSAPPALAEHPDFALIAELGQGGMGVVYLARNRLLGRIEVLKVLRRDILDRPGARERFLREIRAVGQLSHPNIVAAHAAFRLGDDLVLAMEHVVGTDLGRFVQSRTRLTVDQSACYAYQVALGLQHAHERGLVHRDIKPTNLMLASEGGRPVIKVLDFGLARVAREEESVDGLTGAGLFLGTPEYVAPEQIRDARRADIRADIYSLGCTLYSLLAGRPPFRDDSLVALFDAHRAADPSPLTALRGDVPPALASMISRMMAKEPGDRFASPGDVAKALAPFFDEARVAVASLPAADGVGPNNPTEPATPFAATAAEVIPTPARSRWRPRPLAVGVSASLLVALVSLGAWAILDGRRAPPPDSRLAGPSYQGTPRTRADRPAWVPLSESSGPRGWSPKSGDWRVEGGVIRGTSRANDPSHAQIATERSDFGDFHLRFEMLSHDNMTKQVIFRSTGSGETSTNYRFFTGGVRYDGAILPPGEFLVTTGENGDVLSTTAEGVETIVPLVGIPPPSPGAWHSFEVIARGNEHRFRLDGADTATVLDARSRQSRGRIEFRLRQGSSAAFRKIEILETDGPAAPQTH